MSHIVEIWDGYVTEICDDSFWCRLEDEDGDEYEASFGFHIIPEHEKEFLSLGAILNIGFLNDGGFIFNFYKEVWTQKEIDEAKKRADEFIEQLREAGVFDD